MRRLRWIVPLVLMVVLGALVAWGWGVTLDLREPPDGIFTQTDPDSVLSATATTLTGDEIHDNSETWAYHDYGAGYFGTTWIQRFDYSLTDTDDAAYCGLWCMSIARDSLYDLNAWGRDFVMLYYRVGNTRLTLVAHGGYEDMSIIADDGATRYIEIERTSSTTLTCKVYSDAYITLVDTLACAVNADDVHRYLMLLPAYHHNDGAYYDATLSDLDLNEAAGPYPMWYWQRAARRR